MSPASDLNALISAAPRLGVHRAESRARPTANWNPVGCKRRRESGSRLQLPSVALRLVLPREPGGPAGAGVRLPSSSVAIARWLPSDVAQSGGFVDNQRPSAGGRWCGRGCRRSESSAFEREVYRVVRRQRRSLPFGAVPLLGSVAIPSGVQ